MIIIDSRAEKIKKIVIAILIVVIIIAVSWLAVAYFGKKTENVEEPSKSGKTEAVSPAEDELKQDRETCLKFFEDLDKTSTEAVKSKEKEIVEADIGKASDYYLCLAVKNNDNHYCDSLNANADALKKCQTRFVQYAKTLFPLLKANRCNTDLIDVCKGKGTSNCESACKGLILKEVTECDNILNDPALKNTCLAINKDDVNVCNSANEDDRKKCQEVFYFFKAVRENNVSHLDKIDHVNFRPIARLYFDPKAQCEKILAGFGDYACNQRFPLIKQ